ncbi:MAG: winged helix-turn-helix transcriptional regulator [Beutenbergiaceae bacterium]
MSQPQLRSQYEGHCQAHGNGSGIREVLERIGDKWSLLIIGTLTSGPLRFGELRAHIPGISQRMLTRTLRYLERDGLVSRTSHPQVPPRVDYALTSLGRTLIEPSAALAAWALANQDQIAAARQRFDDSQASAPPAASPRSETA